MASLDPLAFTLDVVPRARFDVLDLRTRLPEAHREALRPYSHCLYWSSHTTAGFLDRSMACRLAGQSGVTSYVQAFRALFPEGAGYVHDHLDRRTELAPEQRLVEPRNADSHVAFITAGLRTCVTYPNQPGLPVCFVELDGMHDKRPRRRITRIIGYQREREVARTQIEVPVSPHPIDSINLKDPRFGIYDQLADLIARHHIAKGRLRLSLHEGERHAGLTVNEYETLLMQHDLADVLRDPLRFALEKGRHLWADPRAVPSKTLGYAKYDVVHVMNQFVDLLGLRESMVERLFARALAVPAARFFRMKRSVSLLVSDQDGSGRGRVVEGRYQSTILLQWHQAPRKARRNAVTLTTLQ